MHRQAASRSEVSRTLRIVALCAAILIALLLSARAAPAPVDEIHLATVNSNYRRALEKIAREYEALHPDVHVRISIITNQYSTWLRTQFAGGEQLAPDIYNGNYTADYVALGRWTPLNGYFEQTNPYTGKKWIESLNKQLTTRFYYGSIAYFVPIDFIDVAFVYNAEVFRQLNLKPPKTWDELLGVCRAIADRGSTVRLRGESGQPIIPMAMSGNAQDFWEGPVGWFTRILSDAYHRDKVQSVMARPGDWNFVADRNTTFSTNYADPYNDVNTTLNNERVLNAIHSGELQLDGPAMRRVYERIIELSQYWPRGFQGINFGSSEALFVKQKAAILFTTSHFVMHTTRVWRGLDPADRFEWNSFPVPSITGDPLCVGPTIRGIGNAGANYVVTKKSDPAHEKRVVNFMMFLTRPESGQALFDETLADDQFIVGPIQIQGVKMPAELERKYASFLGRGFEKIDFRGTVIEYEWTRISQELLGGRIPLDEYLKQYRKLGELRIEREVKRQGLDLDPTTDDSLRTRPTEQPSRWNPLRSGPALIALLLIAYGAAAAVAIRRARGLKLAQTITAYSLLIPTFALLACFCAFPALAGLYQGFTEWQEGSAQRFVGLANFRRLAGDALLHRSVANLIIVTMANLLKATIIPFLVAEMLLALPWPRLRYFFRTLFLIPMVVPAITVILIWGFVFDPNIGMLNSLLAAFGIQGPSWLGESWLALPSIIGIGFPWIGPLGLLIFLAGLLQIPGAVHDSAILDCPRAWQRILYVDLPLVSGQMRLVVIMALIGSLQDFQTVLLMTNGGPGLATSLPALQMYQRAFQFGEYGYASSIGFVLFLLIVTLTALHMRLFRRKDLA